MRFDFFPDVESEMVQWGANFARQLQARVGHFGVPDDIVAAFAQAQALFKETFDLATSAQTRTSGAVARKNEARRSMEQLARAIARQLRYSVSLSDADRFALGLNVPKKPVRTIAPPADGPELQVLRNEHSEVTVRLIDVERQRSRARPDSATSALIFHQFADRESELRDAWTLTMPTSQTTVTLPFDRAMPPGTTVFLTALWQSRRGKPSARSRPVRVRVGEGEASPRQRRCISNLPSNSFCINHPDAPSAVEAPANEDVAA